MRKEVITFRDPKSPISEVFRTLRTNIQFMNVNKNLKTLLVTSTLPKEGKSWIASNLAITFAQAEKKVLLIDADMRKGRQYYIFGVSPRPGLANYLSECKENAGVEDIGKYIQETEIQDLHMIAAGNVPPNPSELLITPQMNNLLQKMSTYYDIIIVDAPPCELVTDAVILSRIVDSTVVVAAYKQTKKASLQNTIKSIKNVGGNIAGVVFNKVHVDGKKYEKSYYYGSQLVPANKKKEKQAFFDSSDKQQKKESKHSESVSPKEAHFKPADAVTYDSEVHSINDKDEKTEVVNENETTESILKQVNEYLEREKQNLENSRRDK